MSNPYHALLIIDFQRETMTEAMTPQERWQAVLSGQLPDRLPMDYWATGETTAKLLKHLGSADVFEMYDKLHIDKIVGLKPVYVGPPLDPNTDMYGCRYADVDYGTGSYEECVYNPLAQYTTIEEIEDNYTWPTADWFDYSQLPQQVAKVAAAGQYPIQAGGSEPFLTYTYLRGMQQAYIDLLTDRPLVEYCLDKLFGFCYEDTSRIYEAIPGQVDVSYVAEDLGSQESLLFSPQVIREVFIPRMKRMMDLVHENGAHVFFHSDGAVFDIIPDMITAGIDIINPLQWRCAGMERDRLKTAYGADVVLHGGMDNQQTLAFGTVDDVIAETRYNIAVLGAGGGYILAPCHNLQAVSPVENIVAMYEVGYAEGRY